MKILWFEGSSDDTFGMTRNGDDTRSCDDYDNCASGKPIEWRVWSPETDEGLIVVGQYAPGNAEGWLVGVAPAPHVDGEEHDIPAWTIRFEAGSRPYSPRLVIEAPADVQVDCLTRIDSEEGDDRG